MTIDKNSYGADEQDAIAARRYRWIREESNLVAGTHNGIGLACGSWRKDDADKLALDARIDAEIAKEPQP